MEKMQANYDKIFKRSQFHTGRANQIIQMKIQKANQPLVKAVGPEPTQVDLQKISSVVKDRNSKFVKFVNSLMRQNNANNYENSKLINNVINAQKLNYVNCFKI